jgi:hypothetical protein
MRAQLSLLLAASLLLSGCDTGIREMGPNEVGVIFRKIPPQVGGGISRQVVGRGEKRVVFPWDEIYRFNVTPRFITWGSGKGRNTIFARAKDGNEVALTVTLAYQLSSDPQKTLVLMQEFAASDEAIEAMVETAARSDIRTYMNELGTLEFRQAEKRGEAVAAIKKSLNNRFGSFGIEVLSVNLDDFQFKRLAPDGTEDSSYQKMIDQIQARVEDTKRKYAEKETVKAAKEAELAVMQARRVSLMREAEGYKKALAFRGDGYLTVKTNEAEGIKKQGEATVQGLIEQVKAFSGPGGAALLKLEIAKQILKNDPHYVLMSESKQGSLEVKRTDSNELLQQLGVMDALQPKTPAKPVPSESPAGK